MSTAMRPERSTPLPGDWSPADIWLAIGDEHRQEQQQGIDAFKARLTYRQGWCGHSCEQHDDLAYAYVLYETDVIKALNAESTLSGPARQRLFAALGIELD